VYCESAQLLAHTLYSIFVQTADEKALTNSIQSDKMKKSKGNDEDGSVSFLAESQRLVRADRRVSEIPITSEPEIRKHFCK